MTDEMMVSAFCNCKHYCYSRYETSSKLEEHEMYHNRVCGCTVLCEGCGCIPPSPDHRLRQVEGKWVWLTPAGMSAQMRIARKTS